MIPYLLNQLVLICLGSLGVLVGVVLLIEFGLGIYLASIVLPAKIAEFFSRIRTKRRK